MPTDKPDTEQAVRTDLPNGWYFTGDDFLGCRSLYRPGFEQPVAYFGSEDAIALAAAMAPQDGLRAALERLIKASAATFRENEAGIAPWSAESNVATELYCAVTIAQEALAATPAAQQEAPAAQSDANDIAEKIEPIIARHVEARTKPLVEALDYVDGMLGEFLSFGAMPPDYVRLRQKVRQALAQEKGRRGG
jgi:hypothetical protein